MSLVPVYLDSVVIIDALDGEQDVSEPAQIALRRLRDRSAKAVTSELTLAECLAPQRRRGTTGPRSQPADLYTSLLMSAGLVELIAVSRAILLATVEVRREQAMKLPDAIHLATAVTTKCRLFLTRNLGLRSMPAVTIISPLDPELPQRLSEVLA